MVKGGVGIRFELLVILNEVRIIKDKYIKEKDDSTFLIYN